MATDVLNFIGGEHRPAASGEWLDNIEPATGEAYGRIARSGAADVDVAVAAARKAFGKNKFNSIHNFHPYTPTSQIFSCCQLG